MEKLIVAGFGGQGVLSLGQMIAYAAMYQGKEVTWLPSYGPEMRGGTANCSVVVDDKAVASPVIAQPDTLIAMNKPSLDKFLSKVKSGGRVIINSSLIKDKVDREDVKVVYVDANAVAHEIGNDKASNLVVLGAYIKASGLFPKEVMLSTIEKTFTAKPKFIPSNQAAFLSGFESV
jgi:2-oxoglutarate ferredoxin oxidoreductase subunit gamma